MATLTMTVSKEKKCAQLNGLRKFPVSLYYDEWLQVLNAAPKILEFLKAHEKELSRKADAPAKAGSFALN